MAKSFEGYCKNCETTRSFYLMREGTSSDTYKCSYCSLEKEKMNAGGVATVGLNAVRAVFSIFGGGGFPPFPRPPGTDCWP